VKYMGYKKEIYEKWYQKNKKRIKEVQKKYYQNNKEKVRKMRMEYYYKNRDKQLESMKEYREKNKDKILQLRKDYYSKNKKEINQKSKLYRESNKGRGTIRLYRKRENNYLKFLALQTISKKRIPECIKCGERDIRILTINHLNGIGMKNRKLEITVQFYRRIISGKRKIDDLDIRCCNCNILYEYERGKRFFDKEFLENKLKEQNVLSNLDFIEIRN
jgi:exonuclease VII large subunit